MKFLEISCSKSVKTAFPMKTPRNHSTNCDLNILCDFFGLPFCGIDFNLFTFKMESGSTVIVLKEKESKPPEVIICKNYQLIVEEKTQQSCISAFNISVIRVYGAICDVRFDIKKSNL